MKQIYFSSDGLTNGYRPVILMHGVQFLLGPKGLSGLANFIKDAHPGTVVTNVDAFTGMVSHIQSSIIIMCACMSIAASVSISGQSCLTSSYSPVLPLGIVSGCLR